MAETTRIAVARTLFESWGSSFDDLVAGFKRAMAPNAFFQQTRTPDLSGIDQIVEFLHTARRSGVMETIDVELVNMIDDGRFVVSERVDRMKDASGRVMATMPCVGIMEFDGDRIAVWRDYFDTADLQSDAASFIGQK